MIQQTAEYALRAVVWLASHPGPPQTSDQIAKGTLVPPRYLYKVLQTLTQAGMLRSQPGPKGGYSLARSAEEMSILDVINAVSPIQRIGVCPLGLDSHGPNLCPLHRELDNAYAQIERAFSQVTIARLLKSCSDVSPLCECRGSETAAAKQVRPPARSR